MFTFLIAKKFTKLDVFDLLTVIIIHVIFHTSTRYQMSIHVLVGNLKAHLSVKTIGQIIETRWRKITTTIWHIFSGPPDKSPTLMLGK